MGKWIAKKLKPINNFKYKLKKLNKPDRLFLLFATDSVIKVAVSAVSCELLVKVLAELSGVICSKSSS